MTRKEIENRITELENKRFFLAMKDKWTGTDFRQDDDWLLEIIELKRELEKVA